MQGNSSAYTCIKCPREHPLGRASPLTSAPVFLRYICTLCRVPGGQHYWPGTKPKASSPSCGPKQHHWTKGFQLCCVSEPAFETALSGAPAEILGLKFPQGSSCLKHSLSKSGPSTLCLPVLFGCLETCANLRFLTFMVLPIRISRSRHSPGLVSVSTDVTHRIMISGAAKPKETLEKLLGYFYTPISLRGPISFQKNTGVRPGSFIWAFL